MGDVEMIRAALSELSKDVKGVAHTVTAVQIEQAASGAKISQLELNSASARLAIDSLVQQSTKIEVKIEDICQDTEKQWEHLTAAKDQSRDMAVKSASKGSTPPPFWDTGTKQRAMTMVGAVVILGMLLIAGQSGLVTELAGMYSDGNK